MVEILDASKEAAELRETWQARALAATQSSHLGAVLLSVLAHSYDEALPVLLRVVFPGFQGLKPPGLISAGKIGRTGSVVADVVLKGGLRKRNSIIFSDKKAMESAFRKLADRLKLSDKDRREMFCAVQRWVVCDYRRNPRMDPRDPDAISHAVN